MTRPKGSLNRIKKPKVKYIRKPKPKKEKEEHLTLKELKAIAKERGVKLKCNVSHSELREVLGMEPIEIPKRYHHCKSVKSAQVVIKTNVTTGEETKFKSIFELANSFNMFAGSITYRIKNGKSLEINGDTYTFHKELQ